MIGDPWLSAELASRAAGDSPREQYRRVKHTLQSAYPEKPLTDILDEIEFKVAVKAASLKASDSNFATAKDRLWQISNAIEHDRRTSGIKVGRWHHANVRQRAEKELAAIERKAREYERERELAPIRAAAAAATAARAAEIAADRQRYGAPIETYNRQYPRVPNGDYRIFTRNPNNGKQTAVLVIIGNQRDYNGRQIADVPSSLPGRSAEARREFARSVVEQLPTVAEGKQASDTCPHCNKFPCSNFSYGTAKYHSGRLVDIEQCARCGSVWNAYEFPLLVAENFDSRRR